MTNTEILDDYYSLLGLSFPSTERDIAKAYRKTALKYHPDKNPNDEVAAALFLQLRVAYDILSHPNKKERYDVKIRAKLERQKHFEKMNAERRKIKEDLERRENAGKKQKLNEDASQMQNTIDRLREETRYKQDELIRNAKKREVHAEHHASVKQDSFFAPPDNSSEDEFESNLLARMRSKGK